MADDSGETIQIEITPAMIEAGVAAFLERASYDERSLYLIEDTMAEVLASAFHVPQDGR